MTHNVKLSGRVKWKDVIAALSLRLPVPIRRAFFTVWLSNVTAYIYARLQRVEK